MNKFAMVAVAGALALAPAIASATGDTTPKSGGVGPQGLFLNTQTTINFTVTPACTALSTPNTVNFSAQPTTNNPTAQQGLTVSWNCGAGIRPNVTFLGTGSNPCNLVNGAFSIPYSIFASGTSGTNLCNATDTPADTRYDATAGEAGANSHTFNIVTGTLVDGNGHSLFPAQTYTDTVNVFLDF